MTVSQIITAIGGLTVLELIEVNAALRARIEEEPPAAAPVLVPSGGGGPVAEGAVHA